LRQEYKNDISLQMNTTVRGYQKFHK